MQQLPQTFLDQVTSRFSTDFLNASPEVCEAFGGDWTRVFKPCPSAVVRPRSTTEVAQFLSLCQQYAVQVVPSGGRTGLAGGAVAPAGEVVLSMSRMAQMHPVDTLGQTLRVQAGAVTEAVHQHCAAAGLTWPVDFASKGSSHVGGNIATNAGGVRVIRYGLTRQWVLGLQVVLASGQILELGGALEKNNTGPDLRQLFIGSEGTLGVITEATLKLCPKPRDPQVMLFATRDLQQTLALYAEARKSPYVVNAFEYFTEACCTRLQRHRALSAPFGNPSPSYVLCEVECADAAGLSRWVDGVFERGAAQDGVLAVSSAQANGLWALREGISESLSATGMPHKNDIAVPIAELEGFCRSLEEFFVTHYAGWEICLFGHIGDGNLHLNVMKPENMTKQAFIAHTHAVDDAVFSLVQKHRGSISAEHGIGLLKKDFLHYSRTATEIELFRNLKKSFDPTGILNPGKIF